MYQKINLGFLGFESHDIDTNGKVWSLNYNRPKKAVQAKNGYLRVTLRKKGESKVFNFCVHRLVAEAFLPKQEGLGQVNHINSNKTDNRLVNLEWTNTTLNQRHSVEYRKQNNIYFNNGGVTRKPVKIVNLPDVIIFNSLNECARYINADRKTITDAIKEDRKCKGYKVEYVNT